MVDIVIVNWNTKQLLYNCLSFLTERSQGRYRIHVVDNASSDGSAEMVKVEFPSVHLSENLTNVGFARANNLVLKTIKITEANNVLLLNTDVEFPQHDVIERMEEYLEQNPDVGAISPALFFPSGLLQTGTAGHTPSWKTGFNSFLFLSNIFPQIFKGFIFNLSYAVKRGRPLEVDWVGGACLMFRASIIQHVGLLDSSFFMYAEDVEWCERIRSNGWKVVYLPSLRIIHYQGASSTVKKSNDVRWFRSLCFYVKMKQGLSSYVAFRLLATVGFSARCFVFGCLAMLTSNKRSVYLQKLGQSASCLAVAIKG
jgi:GT2 family glycosyltransferase